MAKRFYEKVSVSQADGFFHILLDGRKLKTPGKQPLLIPSRYIADLIAAEWDAQESEIDPTSMPVTRLLNVAVEQTPTNRPALVAEFRRYTGSDLLSYHAPDPSDLTQRQSDDWTPWLNWAAKRGVTLKTTIGIVAISQPAESLDAAAEYASRLDDLTLTLLVHLTAVYGSAVLAMATVEGALSAEAAYELSRLDEIFQNEMWGEDEDAVERNQYIREDTIALSKILDVTKG